MKKLSSKENPLVKKLLKFKERPERFIPKADRQEAEILVEGPKVIETALQAGVRFTTVAVSEGFVSAQRHTELLDMLLGSETPVVVLEDRLLKHLSETVTPQGIVAIARYRMPSLESLSEASVLSVADGIQDPGNMGSLIRCSDAAGLPGVVVLKGSANPFHPKVIRASAGSLFHLKTTIVEREDFIDFTKKQGFHLVYTAQAAETDVFSWKPHLPLAIVFGNEAHGVSEEIRRLSSQAISIPIYGKAESLNVTAASAVVLYHIARSLRSS